MSYCWLQRAETRPAGAQAWARVWTTDGTPAGGLAALPAGAGDLAEVSRRAGAQAAVKVDSRAVDPTGLAGYVSLTWAPAGSWLPFDDVAVSGAIRRALAGPAYDLVSALSQSDNRFLGALVGVLDEDPGAAGLRLADDPFATLFPRRVLRVEAGLLGRMPDAVGPSMQRYGAGSPWPWDRFPEPEPEPEPEPVPEPPAPTARTAATGS